MRMTWKRKVTLWTPRVRQNGRARASFITKTPKNGRGPKMVLRLTPREITRGIMLKVIMEIALISAVSSFRPGGFENMNFLTIHPWKTLSNDQIIHNVTTTNLVNIIDIIF